VEATALIVPAGAGAVADACWLLLEQAVTPRAEHSQGGSGGEHAQMLIEALLLVARTENALSVMVTVVKFTLA
jgi:hypothetical protein